MKGRRKQPAKKDHFPYLVLAGVCIVALLASALISGIHVRAPTENVAGQAFENPTAQVEVCGKTIYLDGPGNRKELYSRTGTEAPVKISEALLADGQVYKFAVTPDGQYALYLARKTVANPQPTVNLYRVSLNGGEVVRLNSPLPDNTQVNDVAISPDSQYVAYTADLGQVGGHAQFDLYTVPITGGVATRRTTVAIQNDVWPGIIFTPDSQRIVYATHNTVSGDAGLYSAARASGSSTTLVDPEERVDREEFAVSCDSQTAYFFTDPVGSSRQLYSIPVSGGTSTPLTGTALPTLNCPAVTPTCGNTNTGTPHVFIDDLDTPNKNELYSENTVTNVITKISDPIPNDEDVTNFQVTPDGERVVYRAGKGVNEPPTQIPGGNWQLYSVPSVGGPVLRISGPMQVLGGVGQFKLLPNGQRVVYAADVAVNTGHELFSVPILGGTPVNLSGPVRIYFTEPAPITSNVVDFFISPDSQRVVYLMDKDTWTMYDAHSVSIMGGASTRISHTLPADHDVEGILISPNSQRVVYRAVRTAIGKGELYSVPILGGTTTRISQEDTRPTSSTSTIDVMFDYHGLGAVVSCDSQTVYYLADTIPDGSTDELYSVPMTSGTITPLSGHTLPILNCAVTPPACTAIGASCTANANCCSNVCSTGMCTTPPSNDGETDPRYAPPVDPNSGQRYLTVAAGSSGVSVTTTAGNGRYIWRYGYYLNDSQWTRFAIAPNGVAGTNWTNSTNNLNLPAGAPATGYVIIYACKKYTAGGNYTCGPRNTTQASSARYWTIAPYGATQACADECTTGATTCFGTSGVRTCGNYDADTCLDWNPTPTTCTGGTTCANGVCGSGGGGGNNGVICIQQLGARCNDNGRPDGSTQIDAYCVQCPYSGGGTACGVVSRCYQCQPGQVMVHDSSVSAEWRCSGSTAPCDPVCGQGQTCTDGVCGTTGAECTPGCTVDQTCSNGVCVGCTPDCTAGETDCTDNLYKTCGNFDTTDSCLEWSTATACPANKVCGGNVCVDETTPPICNLWDRRCQNNNVEYCGDTNNDDVLEWNIERACGTQTCTSPEPQTTPKSATCGTATGCGAGESNNLMMSGGWGSCGAGSRPGTCWESDRQLIGHEAVCVNAATQCVWSSHIMNLRDEFVNGDYEYLCGDKGQGPTLFACSPAHDGQTLAASGSWCCRNNRFTTGAC